MATTIEWESDDGNENILMANCVFAVVDDFCSVVRVVSMCSMFKYFNSLRLSGQIYLFSMVDSFRLENTIADDDDEDEDEKVKKKKRQTKIRK